jgi:hypothetical protein
MTAQLESLTKGLFGARAATSVSIKLRDLTLDSQKLGLAPLDTGALGCRKRLLDRGGGF